jgi:hypothetical protein
VEELIDSNNKVMILLADKCLRTKESQPGVNWVIHNILLTEKIEGIRSITSSRR